MITQNALVTYLAENFDPIDLETLDSNGAAAGVPGLIYYKETEAIYDKFEALIWATVESYCEDNGFKLGEILHNILGGECPGHYHLANNLVWFACEYYATDARRLQEERND